MDARGGKAVRMREKAERPDKVTVVVDREPRAQSPEAARGMEKQPLGGALPAGRPEDNTLRRCVGGTELRGG